MQLTAQEYQLVDFFKQIITSSNVMIFSDLTESVQLLEMSLGPELSLCELQRSLCPRDRV